MVSPWLTVAVILFGIIVSIVCVFAYLRVYRSGVWSEPDKTDSNSAPRKENYTMKLLVKRPKSAEDDNK